MLLWWTKPPATDYSELGNQRIRSSGLLPVILLFSHANSVAHFAQARIGLDDDLLRTKGRFRTEFFSSKRMR